MGRKGGRRGGARGPRKESTHYWTKKEKRLLTKHKLLNKPR